MSGTARIPWGWPPRRARAWAVPGEWIRWPRSAWREFCTIRKTVSADIGTLTCLTGSGGSKPRAYQPMALVPLRMNMAARSTYCATSLTR